MLNNIGYKLENSLENALPMVSILDGISEISALVRTNI